MTVLNCGRLPLPFVELLLEVTRLASLEMVSCLTGKLDSLTPVLGVDRQSENASCGLRIDSTALFDAAFFSFFSMSLATAFRLRAPLADIIGYCVFFSCTQKSQKPVIKERYRIKVERTALVMIVRKGSG